MFIDSTPESYHFVNCFQSHTRCTEPDQSIVFVTQSSWRQRYCLLWNLSRFMATVWLNSRFSQTNNNGNNGNIAIYVFPYICSFLLYSNYIVLVNAKLDITGYKRITFQGWILWLYSKFQMVQLKHKWQYWHSCIAESLWKPRLSNTDTTVFNPFQTHIHNSRNANTCCE